MFPKARLFHHWFRWCYHNQWWLVYRRIYASPSLNELKWKPNSPVVNELTKFGTTLSSTQCCEITLDDNAKSTIGNHYIIYSRYIAVQYNTILHTPQLWRYNFGHTSGTHESHQYLALTGELWVSFVIIWRKVTARYLKRTVKHKIACMFIRMYFLKIILKTLVVTIVFFHQGNYDF